MSVSFARNGLIVASNFDSLATTNDGTCVSRLFTASHGGAQERRRADLCPLRDA